MAFAQTYFAVQTSKQETIEQRLLDVDKVSARDKLSKSEKKLSGIIYERGVDDIGFTIIRSKGDQADATKHKKAFRQVAAWYERVGHDQPPQNGIGKQGEIETIPAGTRTTQGCQKNQEKG